MSRERELLESCLDEMQYHNLVCPELKIDIKELLAQPEHLGGVTDMVERKQPLSELININKEWYQIGYEAAKQELKREPLSEDWIKNNIHLIHRDVSFTDLVRGIEKAHGIGVDDE